MRPRKASSAPWWTALCSVQWCRRSGLGEPGTLKGSEDGPRTPQSHHHPPTLHLGVWGSSSPLQGPDVSLHSVLLLSQLGLPAGSDGKESTCSVEDLSLIPGVGRSADGESGNPFQYSCLEHPHGQRRLVGCSPWDCKESDTTE